MTNSQTSANTYSIFLWREMIKKSFKKITATRYSQSNPSVHNQICLIKTTHSGNMRRQFPLRSFLNPGRQMPGSWLENAT